MGNWWLGEWVARIGWNLYVNMDWIPRFVTLTYKYLVRQFFIKGSFCSWNRYVFWQITPQILTHKGVTFVNWQIPCPRISSTYRGVLGENLLFYHTHAVILTASNPLLCTRVNPTSFFRQRGKTCLGVSRSTVDLNPPPSGSGIVCVS